MPLYEFRCPKCNKTFTVTLTVKDFEAHNYQCPSCQNKEVEEQFSGVSVMTSKKS
jgi:putative FmdB family regulatory protein